MDIFTAGFSEPAHEYHETPREDYSIVFYYSIYVYVIYVSNIHTHIILYVIIHSIAHTYSPEDSSSHAVSWDYHFRAYLGNTALDSVTHSLSLREHLRTKR